MTVIGPILINTITWLLWHGCCKINSMRIIKLMNKTSEKINGKSMGGLMKIRFLALVLGTMAIMVSGAAYAESKLTLDIPVTVKGFEMDFSKMFGTGSNEDTTKAFNFSQCIYKESGDLDTTVNGILGLGQITGDILSAYWTHLDAKDLITYQTHKDDNNTILQMYLKDKDVELGKAYYHDFFRFGGAYNGSNGSWNNYSPNVGAYAADQTADAYDNYFDSFDFI